MEKAEGKYHHFSLVLWSTKYLSNFISLNPHNRSSKQNYPYFKGKETKVKLKGLVQLNKLKEEPRMWTQSNLLLKPQCLIHSLWIEKNILVCMTVSSTFPYLTKVLTRENLRIITTKCLCKKTVLYFNCLSSAFGVLFTVWVLCKFIKVNKLNIPEITCNLTSR